MREKIVAFGREATFAHDIGFLGVVGIVACGVIGEIGGVGGEVGVASAIVDIGVEDAGEGEAGGVGNGTVLGGVFSFVGFLI